MRKQRRLYSFSQLVSAILMVASLLWLTVSLPYVYEAKQITVTEKKTQCEDPFSSTTEEKAPTVNATEEFLHDNEHNCEFPGSKIDHLHTHHYDIYIAFHGELISPPPDIPVS